MAGSHAVGDATEVVELVVLGDRPNEQRVDQAMGRDPADQSVPVLGAADVQAALERLGQAAVPAGRYVAEVQDFRGAHDALERAEAWAAPAAMTEGGIRTLTVVTYWGRGFKSVQRVL